MKQPLSLAGYVLACIDRHGTPEEKKLARTHQDNIRKFLDHPDTRHFTLDIGLENRLVLKFNLIANSRRSPYGMMDLLADQHPILRPAADFVLQHRLRCHVGMKLLPDSVEYEFYPYETEDKRVSRLLVSRPPDDETGLPSPPYCYGIDSGGGISAYSGIRNIRPDELNDIMKMEFPVSELKAHALFHSKLHENLWKNNKAGIEFLPFPSYLLNKAITHLNIKFPYIIHRGGKRSYGVIGLHNERNVIYTTLLPRRTA